MKRVIVLTIVLLSAGWLGLKIHHDPGYVLMSYRHTAIETTLWFAILALALFHIVLSLTFRTSHQILSMPSNIHQWIKDRSKHKAHHNTLKGIQAFMQGEWHQAEKLLLHSAKKSRYPHLNYLFAAKAASRRSHTALRDDYLKLAFDEAPDASFTVSLTQAQLQIEQKQYEQALATLKQLHQQQPQHLWVCKQLVELYTSLKEWPPLTQLLPTIKRHKLMSKDEITQLEVQAQCNLMQQTTSRQKLNDHWQASSKEAQNDTRLLKTYCQKLIELGQDKEASKKLKKHLNKQWDDSLLGSYSSLSLNDPKQTLLTLLPWAKKHGQSAPLLCQIGQCYLAQQLIGQAKHYLELSTQADKTYSPPWDMLAEIAETEHDFKQAFVYAKKAQQSKSQEK